MTTLSEARSAIYKRFKDEWVDENGNSYAYFVFDNEEADPPSGPDAKGALWARVYVRNINNGQETLGRAGNRRFRRRALAKVDIFAPPMSAISESTKAQELALSMFEGRIFSGTTIIVYDVIPREIGLIDEGKWFFSTIEAQIEYEQIK